MIPAEVGEGGREEEPQVGVAGREDEPQVGVAGREDEPQVGVAGREEEPQVGEGGSEDEPQVGVAGREEEPQVGEGGSEDEPQVGVAGREDEPQVGVVGREEEPQRSVPSRWRKLKEDAEKKQIEILSTLVVLIISAGIIGVGVPVCINNAAINRVNRQRCWEMTLELRKNVNTVQDGFVLLPASPIPRRADLRAVQLTLRNAKFACREVDGVAGQLGSIDLLISSADDLMNRSQVGTLTTNAEFEETGFVIAINDWTDEVLQQLAD